MDSQFVPTLFSELTYSQSDGDRTLAKSRFEDRCKLLESQLNLRVLNNRPNVNCVLEYTSNAIATVETAKKKCKDLKEKLLTCKSILQCKQDEIRELWIDSLQHQYAYKLLDEIDKLRKVPKTVDKSLLQKKYLHAAQVLASSIQFLEKNLNTTDALTNLKSELLMLKDKSYSIYLEELCQEIFMSSKRFIDHDSSKDAKVGMYQEIFKCQTIKGMDGSFGFNVAYADSLIECIYLLGKVPETFEILKEECPTKLIRIIYKLSKLMNDTISRSFEVTALELPLSQQKTFLIDFFDTIIAHFRQIIVNYSYVFKRFEKMFPCHLKDPWFNVTDLYSSIQGAMEQLLNCYLEIQTSSRRNSEVITNAPFNGNLNAYYLQKPDDSFKTPLFAFSSSLQGMLKTRKIEKSDKLCRENSDVNISIDSLQLNLICTPSLTNTALIFNKVKQFCEETSNSLKLEAKTHCPLYLFISDCINQFFEHVNMEANKILESYSLSLESWNSISLSDETSEDSTAEKQILAGTLIVNNYLKELKELVLFLPDFSDHFVQLIYFVILHCKDSIHKLFKSLFVVEQNILSVSWAKDGDIRRLLKSFSNWKHLEVTESGETIESPEEIRLRNKEESELLLRNLHSDEQASWEIISDYETLFRIALLEESLLWFYTKLLQTIKELYDIIPESDANESSPTGRSLNNLQKLAKEYEDFSDVCLLALHLEVRAHCFHHLLHPIPPDQTPETHLQQELQTTFSNLANNLLKMDEILHPVLTTKELKYIFEGLGELVSAIIIFKISTLNWINKGMVQGLYRCIQVVQCCLGNITLTREMSLERAKSYIRLLNQTCEEILNKIVEQGPRFKEQQYIAIFKLILEKKDKESVMLAEYVERLQRIFHTS